METLRKGRYICYMVSITIGALSFNGLFALALFFNSANAVVINSFSPPFVRLAGALIATWFIKYGRRNMLLVADAGLTVTALLGWLEIGEWYSTIINIAIPFIYGFAYLSIILYIKEIPMFLQHGYPLCFFLCFNFMGTFVGELFQLLCNYVYKVEIMDNQYWHIRLLMLLGLSLPAITQALLLLFVFKHEPLQYYVNTNFEESAIIAADELYSDKAVGLHAVDVLVAKHDEEKYTVQTWGQLLSASTFNHVAMNCAMLFICYSIGYLVFQRAVFTLSDESESYYLLTGYSLCVFWLLLSIAYMDKFAIWQLELLGFALAFILCTITLLLYLLGLTKSHFYIPFPLLASAVIYAFVIVPAYKFALGYFSDKGTCLCVCSFFLGGLLWTFDVAFKPNVVALIDIVWGIIASALGALIAFTYTRKYERHRSPRQTTRQSVRSESQTIPVSS
jgi:hypothetical protein